MATIRWRVVTFFLLETREVVVEAYYLVGGGGFSRHRTAGSGQISRKIWAPLFTINVRNKKSYK